MKDVPYASSNTCTLDSSFHLSLFFTSPSPISPSSFSLSKLYAGARFELALYARQSFDRESQPAFAPSVVCVDGGHPRRTSIVPLQIVVEDVNDNPPRLTGPNGVVHFAENQPAGSLVLKAIATDLDVGINARLIYSLDAASQRVFRINEFNGEVKGRKRDEKGLLISSFHTSSLLPDSAISSEVSPAGLTEVWRRITCNTINVSSSSSSSSYFFLSQRTFLRVADLS